MQWSRLTPPNARRVAAHHFSRLRQTVDAARPRAVATWLSIKPHAVRSYQWLTGPQQAIFLLAGIGLLFVNVIAAAAVIAAWVALIRHYAQTEADRQRRITESFGKATEQLASEKIEARLGGIYTLERISRESPDDYWIVMETLTAFLREHARWKEQCQTISKTSGTVPELATDIVAVLTVIVRRDDQNRHQEKLNGWKLDFRGSNLRGADLRGAHLEGANLVAAHLEGAFLPLAHLEEANLTEAHLEGAFLGTAHLERAGLQGAHLEGAVLPAAHLERAHLVGAHLKGANLMEAHLEEAFLVSAHLKEANLMKAHLKGANLTRAHLERAILMEAHLKGADLTEAHLEGANLAAAHLKGADLRGAHLEGAYLKTAEGLVQDQLSEASGDSLTKLPQELTPPEHWPLVS
jgi:uncharacterized protein YjbI with pentapeptide repeats